MILPTVIRKVQLQWILPQSLHTASQWSQEINAKLPRDEPSLESDERRNEG